MLHFVAASPLWLDEAQTVAIARLPLAEIPAALRQDGSPPLYYVLLHGWIALFGDREVAVRALSGVLGLAALPVLWRLADRLAGRGVAWTALLLLVSSPFALRYATEARMYSLLILLAALAGLALLRVLERPSATRAALLAGVTGALVLTHYWSLYLVAAVIGVLLWARRPAAGAAVAAGLLALLPWLPSLLVQLAHTGTPWVAPLPFPPLAAVATLAGWGGAYSAATGVALTLLLLWMAVRGGRRPRGAVLAVLAVGPVALGVAVAAVTDGAVAQRYTAASLPAFLLLVALGVVSVPDPPLRRALLGTAVVLGLATGAIESTRDRTQAAEVAAAVDRDAAPGDVVAICPDQLGPALHHALRGDHDTVAFPGGERAVRLDWTDYRERQRSQTPDAFAELLDERAGPGAVWLMWNASYGGLEYRCRALAEALAARRPAPREEVVPSDAMLENAALWRYAPTP